MRLPFPLCTPSGRIAPSRRGALLLLLLVALGSVQWRLAYACVLEGAPTSRSHCCCERDAAAPCAQEPGCAAARDAGDCCAVAVEGAPAALEQAQDHVQRQIVELLAPQPPPWPSAAAVPQAVPHAPSVPPDPVSPRPRYLVTARLRI